MYLIECVDVCFALVIFRGVPEFLDYLLQRMILLPFTDHVDHPELQGVHP